MEAVTPDGPDRDAGVKRRWRIFLGVEAVLTLTFAGSAYAVVQAPGAGPWAAPVLGLLGTWLAFSLPVAVLYLLGRAPAMNLSPLIPSAESRAFRRTLLGRPALRDAEFFDRYYADAGIPEETVVRVRHLCAGYTYDSLHSRLAPGDCIPLLDDELDFAWIVRDVERACGIKFGPEEDRRIDGTFDNLVRMVHARRGADRA